MDAGATAVKELIEQWRKKWQYHVITALKKAVRGTAYEAEWYAKPGAMFR